MQEGFHTLVIGETFPWTLTPALTEDNVGPGSDDSVIYTQPEVPFSMPTVCPTHSRPSTNICGLMDWVNHLQTEWIGADELPVRYV